MNMVELFDNQSGSLIGTISAAQLRYLIDQLEEEDSEDQDYYIDRATLDWFEEHGADPALSTLLREALGSRDGMEICWTDEQ
jgi:processive 1,2-diacylglycerol beta-glucosyltransferase